jgi:hypothetical protein
MLSHTQQPFRRDDHQKRCRLGFQVRDKLPLSFRTIKTSVQNKEGSDSISETPLGRKLSVYFKLIRDEAPDRPLFELLDEALRKKPQQKSSGSSVLFAIVECKCGVVFIKCRKADRGVSLARYLSKVQGTGYHQECVFCGSCEIDKLNEYATPHRLVGWYVFRSHPRRISPASEAVIEAMVLMLSQNTISV